MKTGISGAILCLGVLVGALAYAQADDVNWPINGGTGNIRYSPLTQIYRTNVRSLQVAWTYDSHDAFKDSEMQSNPIIVDGVLFATTPTMKVVAVNAETRQEIWKFDRGSNQYHWRGAPLMISSSRITHLAKLGDLVAAVSQRQPAAGSFAYSISREV